MATKNKETRRGGYRPGSGRPSGSLSKSRDDWDLLLAEKIGAKSDQLINIIVVAAEEDWRAAAYLCDRLAGKARQGVTVDGNAIDFAAAAARTDAASRSYVDPSEAEDADDQTGDDAE